MKKYYLLGTFAAFTVVFNLGYIFHDLIFGQWFHERLGAVSREHYNIPVIAVAFIIYSAIQAYLFPIFFLHASKAYQWSLAKSAIVYGGLIGFLWDGLQGGIIEFATLNIPLDTTLFDSAYHVLEGCLTALIISFFYKKYGMGNVS